MADNTQLDLGAGGDLISTDDVGGGVKVQRVKLQIGADGSASDVHSGNPLPVSDAGGSLTVDNAALSVVGGGTEATAQRVTIASDSTGVLSVDDNGGSLTVDGSVSVSGTVTVDTELPTAGALGDDMANPTTPLVGSCLMVWDGVGGNWDRWVATDGRPAIQGAEGIDAPLGFNPVRVAGRASNAAPAGVSADGDAQDFWINRQGAVATVMKDDAGDSCMDGTNNALRVNIVAGAGSGGTAMTDDTAFTVGSTSVTPAAGYYLAARDTVNDGDAGALAMTATRALIATLETPNGDAVIDDTTNAVQVKLVATDIPLGGTSMTDDTGFTPGTTAVTPAAGIYRSARDLVDDGDAGALAMNQRRGLFVTLEQSNGTEIGTDASPVRMRLVDGTGDTCMDNTNDALRVNVVAGGAGGSVRIIDVNGDSAMDEANDSLRVSVVAGGVYIQDGTGDSCMDTSNDALRVNVVAGGLSGGGFGEAFADIDANGETVNSVTGAYGSGSIEITGTWVGTLQFEARAVSGWHALLAYPVGTTNAPVTSTTGNGAWQFQTGGLSHVRVRASAWTSGTATVITNRDATGEFSPPYVPDTLAVIALGGDPALYVQGEDAHDAPITNNPVLLGARASASAPSSVSADNDVVTLWADGNGRLQVKPYTTTSEPVFTRIVDGAGDSCADDANNAIRVNVVAGAAGGTQFAEDAAHTTADVGTMALAVRRDTAAVGSGTDGDYSTLNVNASGRLYTSTTIDAAIPAGTNNIGDVDVLSVVPGTGATALGKAEDAAAGDGDTGVAILGVRRDSASSGVGADGDYAMFSLDSTGALRVTGGDGSVQGVDAHDAAITADPVLLGARASAAAPTNVSADDDAVRLWALRSGALATQLTAAGALVGGDATNGLDVDVTRLPGSIGAVAHDAAASGCNPVLGGFEARTSDGTAVANGDLVRPMASVLGKLVTHVGALPGSQANGNLNRTTNSAGDVIAAAGAGIKIAVMSITVINKHASVDTTVTIRDGTTAKYGPFIAKADGGGFAPNGGGFPLFVGTANTAITAICGTTGSDVDIFVSGYLTTE